MWWIQVRTIDGHRSASIDVNSRLTKIEKVREKLQKHFDVEPSRQRLFYRGKQLEDGHTLYDYDVSASNIIQLMIRPVETEATASTSGTNTEDLEQENGNGTLENERTEQNSNGNSAEDDEQIGLYKVNERVDARDLTMGAWFEAQVVKVTREIPPAGNEEAGTSQESEPTIHYHVKFEDYSEEEISRVTATDIRPRARHRLQFEQLALGQCVMVNYNSDQPKERGFWYDAVITRKDSSAKEVYARLVLGASTDASEEIKVQFVDEIFRIETREQPGHEDDAPEGEGVARMKKPDCDVCKDHPRRKCKHCACCVCGGKDSPEKQIICDDCDAAYHLWCLTPKLKAVPEDDWYCPDCKTDSSEVIAAGEKLRVKKKMTNCKRDWGRGMATASRTKTCTIVPKNHIGSIPGVPVGSLWFQRLQVSESGVHLPPVGGIHGRSKEGAYSIVLSGGFTEDVDEGEEFVYSGCGSKDLSGNKRTSNDIVCDQKMTKHNLALAVNCDAPVDGVRGATARDWKKGKPIRVVRNYKGRKVSAYCPKEGNRYDGLYKVVRYWPQRNRETGFIVWKYLMRRDDPSPAPWTEEGIQMTKRLGLTMQYPESYLHAAKAKNKKTSNKRKRKRQDEGVDDSDEPECSGVASKQPRYELSDQQLALIEKDTANQKLWRDLLNTIKTLGTAGLLARIQDSLTCVICQEVVYQPVTLSCYHNVCRHCLVRSFRADVHSCPSCRLELDKDFSFQVNAPLQQVLLELFPGYDGGR